MPESALATPPLTTINQPIQQMGSEALRLLIQLIEGQSDTETHVMLPTSLVLRSTTCPPRS
ncbi:substrate-binding domain-containing protein [Tessaracoccus antarcticus]|uniref:Transcriptional regulator LacI/GalR-like sensor domain-containing protein n=1 Tax=Tessaracoccus antarcticus TaxID=2479848 RepID=A0A3M0GA17_9ACTN|nr:substrate-binding domain-containing protein [Tessaracoccus antarcticus]RMB61901.1 hypothetical protein EAX62_04700 [Tessaracoccus antarcticus]